MGGRVSVRPGPGELVQLDIDAEAAQFGDKGLVVDIAASGIVSIPSHETQLCHSSGRQLSQESWCIPPRRRDAPVTSHPTS